MPKFTKLILIPIASLLSTFVVESFAGPNKLDVIDVALFSAMDLDGWENKSFDGHTEYSLAEEGQQSYLKAKSIQSASALYKKIKVDVQETPYLNWSWRVDQPLPPLNEMEKSGDDYAARIYVVFKTGLTPFSARALNYVWSSNASTGTTWPNAFTEKAIMIPIRSSKDEPHAWHQEKINVKEDLLKHFEKLPKYINGVAIMTDTDNSEGTSSASYGDIYFSSN